jgi:hypothetical protein
MKRKLGVLIVVLVILGSVSAVALGASSPAVVTGPARDVTQTTAVLEATVNGGGAATAVQFEWGPTSAYGAASPVRSIGKPSVAISVHATATGLVPGTLYHYVVIATNRFGQSVGRDRTFTTAGHPPPGVVTGPATQITTTTAVLTGALATNGEATTYVFQYGPTPVLGYQTFGKLAPNSGVMQSASFELTGLTPGTTFYYRLVGFHGTTVTSYGSESAFLSEPSPRPVPALNARTTRSRVPPQRFLFTTTGTVGLPASIPAAYGCGGDVLISYVWGRHTYASTLAPVGTNCAFAGQVSVRRRRRHPVELRVVIRFEGNGYLAPRTVHAGRVLLP